MGWSCRVRGGVAELKVGLPGKGWGCRVRGGVARLGWGCGVRVGLQD